MLIFWSLVRNSVVLAVYLLFSVACFFTVHEHSFTGQNSFRDFLCGRLHPYLQKDFSDLFSNPQTEAFMSGKMSNVVIDIVQNWLEQPDCPPPEEFAPWALNLWRSIMGRWKDLGDAWEHTLDHKNA